MKVSKPIYFWESTLEADWPHSFDVSSLSPGQLRIWPKHPELGPILLLKRAVFSEKSKSNPGGPYDVWWCFRDGSPDHYYTAQQILCDSILVEET